MQVIQVLLRFGVPIRSRGNQSIVLFDTSLSLLVELHTRNIKACNRKAPLKVKAGKVHQTATCCDVTRRMNPQLLPLLHVKTIRKTIQDNGTAGAQTRQQD